MATGASEADPKPTGWWGIWFLGFYMVGLFLLLAYLIVVLWPPTLPAGAPETLPEQTKKIVLFGTWGEVHLTPSMRLLVLVLLAGALGALLHALTSFADFVGNRRFIGSWVWWYVLRPFVGAALALIVYFAVRAGFLSVSAGGQAINTFGIVAISALAGLFSKQATDKLDEVFTTLFRTEHGEGDAKRKDRLEKLPLPAPRPTLTSLVPVRMNAGGGPVVVRLVGDGFSEATVIRLDGADRKPEKFDPKELSLTLTAEDTANPRDVNVSTFTPPPGGGESDPLVLHIA
jgi:hypothetical protein